MEGWGVSASSSASSKLLLLESSRMGGMLLCFNRLDPWPV